MQIYKVGGFVRDTLLGLKPMDKDFVVVGSSIEEMIQLGFTIVGKDFPVFIHPKTKEEYALARRDIKHGPGYKGFRFDIINVTLEEDLFRRDFTINAMAMDEQNNLYDPYDGKRDLKQKVIRHISHHFIEDPLRVLRAARFAAKLNFTIDPATLLLMKEVVQSGELQHLSSSRIYLESKKVFETEKPSLYFSYLMKCDALQVIYPEIHHIAIQEDKIFHLLDQITKETKNISTILSVILASLKNNSNLSNSFILSLCKKFQLSKIEIKFVVNHCKWFLTLRRNKIFEASLLLQLLDDFNFFRNRHDFGEFLFILNFVLKENPTEILLQDNFKTLKKVSDQISMREVEKDLLKNNSKERSGKEIGEAIKSLRLEQIQKFLKNTE